MLKETTTALKNEEPEIITTTKEIYNKVLRDYFLNSVELNSAFFDFEVAGIPKKDLLCVYADIQKKINGDYVIRVLEPKIHTEINDDGITTINLYGKKAEEFIPKGMYEDLYTGNLFTFLESFNDQELVTGFCRMDELAETDDGQIFGEIFYFIL